MPRTQCSLVSVCRPVEDGGVPGGGLGGPKGGPEGVPGSGCLSAPDLGFGPERILGKTDLFVEGLWSLFEESTG